MISPPQFVGYPMVKSLVVMVKSPIFPEFQSYITLLLSYENSQLHNHDFFIHSQKMSILSIEDLEFHYFCIISYITSLEIPSPLLMVLIFVPSALWKKSQPATHIATTPVFGPSNSMGLRKNLIPRKHGQLNRH
jgi:hypothetical protein